MYFSGKNWELGSMGVKLEDSDDNCTKTMDKENLELVKLLNDMRSGLVKSQLEFLRNICIVSGLTTVPFILYSPAGKVSLATKLKKTPVFPSSPLNHYSISTPLYSSTAFAVNTAE